jgi:hypothetical protein
VTDTTTNTGQGQTYVSAVNIPADETEVRKFLTIISNHARAVCGDYGRLQLSRVSPIDDKLWVSGRFALDDIEGMITRACEDTAAGYNSYIELRTVRPDLHPNARGTAVDTVEVFGLANDHDADTGKAAELPIRASLVTETSPGNKHDIILTERMTIGDAIVQSPSNR